MRQLTFTIAIALFIIGPTLARAEEQDVLATLRTGHPRLLLLADDIARIKQQIAADATARGYFQTLKSLADQTITQPVAEYKLTGPRLLSVSRLVLERISLCGGMYRLTGERKYADRARDEMLAAAAFADWHPPHFLDTAEMTNGMSIGYDWLYDVLTPEERATIKTAILEKGLIPGLEYQAGRGKTQLNNWNQVCNGGLIVGALAIGDEEPQTARKIIGNAQKLLPPAMAKFAPDGGCEEGPGYWSYAMRYTAYFVGALQSALGTDLGFRQSPGLIDTGMFRIQSAGPAGETFNFADAGSRIARAPEMFFFARAFDRPVYAAHERLLRGERIDPFHLYWFNPDGAAGDISALPTATMFKRINVAFFRSAWSDPKAAFVGFKGGDNTASHAHADLGTFVYDVDGVRWALDLGADDYNLPAYFGEKRYTYYRLRTEGHNTLTIGNENQNIRGGVAPLVAFSPRAGEAFAVADLTAGYAPKVIRAQRGIQLLGRQLLVQDEVEAQEPIDLVWNFHTDSDVVTTHSAAATGMLNHGKHQLNMKILQGDGAAFKVESANPPPPQAQQPKVKNLTIRQPHKTSTLRLAVLFWPQDETPAEVNVRPLAEWIAAAPIAR